MRGRSGLVGFAVLVVAVVVAPFLSHALPHVPARVRRHLPDRAPRARHPHRLHRPDLARSRRVHGHRRVHDHDPRRRPRLARPLDDPGRRRRRRRHRARLRAARRRDSPARISRSRRSRSRSSFIGILKRFPHFTGGNVGKNLPQLHAGVRLAHEPVDLVLRRLLDRRARRCSPLAYLIVRGRFGRALRAVRDSEIAATANGVSTARRQDGRVRASRRSSAASPARCTRSGSPT